MAPKKRKSRGLPILDSRERASGLKLKRDMGLGY
jgi:hypothetical protein